MTRWTSGVMKKGFLPRCCMILQLGKRYAVWKLRMSGLKMEKGTVC